MTVSPQLAGAFWACAMLLVVGCYDSGTPSEEGAGEFPDGATDGESSLAVAADSYSNWVVLIDSGGIRRASTFDVGRCDVRCVRTGP
jgi:hypothetical protein